MNILIQYVNANGVSQTKTFEPEQMEQLFEFIETETDAGSSDFKALREDAALDFMVKTVQNNYFNSAKFLNK